jgi:hypothetical protein
MKFLFFYLLILLFCIKQLSATELYIWDKNLWLAIAKIESNCGKDIKGDKDDKGEYLSRGMFQIQYDTAHRLGFKGTQKQLDKPMTSLFYSEKLLYDLYFRFQGDIYKALFAYNSKWKAVKRMERLHKSFKKTKYVKNLILIIENNEQCETLGF